jgi:hypothetical protein
MDKEPSAILEWCTPLVSSHSAKEAGSPPQNMQARSRESISTSCAQEEHQLSRAPEPWRRKNDSWVILIVVRFVMGLLSPRNPLYRTFAA